MGAEQIDPRLDDFLRGTFTAEQYELIGDRPLVAMPIAVAGTEQVPGEVLKAWAYLQWSYRRYADQSELSMVAHVLRQGTWADVAELLDEQSELTAQQRYAELVVRLSAEPPFH